MTALKPGSRLKSQVDATEVIVVRAPAGEVDLTCGGQPLIDFAAEPDTSLTPDPSLQDGAPIGKRFTLADGDAGLEVLVTKGGQGTLANGTEPLVLKEAKPLPSSD